MLVVYGTGLYFYAKVGIFYLALQEGLLLSLVFVSLSVMLALGIGFFTCVFDYYATDTRFVVPHLLSFWMLATPVIYPLSAIPEPFRWLAWLNPMTAIVEGYRRCMLGVGHLDVLSLSWSVASTLLVFLVGAWFFVRALRHISIRA
jgi:lipopolysaccharide transport system permease protein